MPQPRPYFDLPGEKLRKRVRQLTGTAADLKKNLTNPSELSICKKIRSHLLQRDFDFSSIYRQVCFINVTKSTGSAQDPGVIAWAVFCLVEMCESLKFLLKLSPELVSYIGHLLGPIDSTGLRRHSERGAATPANQFQESSSHYMYAVSVRLLV